MQFGFNVGGPFVLPHLFNGKDRLFFFGDYEGKRVRQAQTFLSSVPIDPFRKGDFSLLLPKTFLTDPRATTKTTLINNFLPTASLHPTPPPLLSLHPHP